MTGSSTGSVALEDGRGEDGVAPWTGAAEGVEVDCAAGAEDGAVVGVVCDVSQPVWLIATISPAIAVTAAVMVVIKPGNVFHQRSDLFSSLMEISRNESIRRRYRRLSWCRTAPTSDGIFPG